MSVAKLVMAAAKLANPAYKIAVTAVLIYSLIQKTKNDQIRPAERRHIRS